MRGKFFLWVLIVISFITTMPIAAQAGNMGPQNKKEHKLHALFLINGKLPHLMKPIKAHWDDPILGLSAKQKEQLKAVQKESMIVINQLKKEIPPLEAQVKQEMMAGRSPEEIKPLVDRIAALKSKGTMVHLRCLYQVRSILSHEQITTLRKLAGKK
jgi:hypothetical protein